MKSQPLDDFQNLEKLSAVYHRAPVTTVALEVARQIRKCQRNTGPLQIGSRAFFEFIYGADNHFVRDFDFRPYYLSQTEDWRKEFFREARIDEVYADRYDRAVYRALN